MREGVHVRVLFRNRLPEPSTIHWHGIHLSFEADGSPLHPVPPGGDHVYAFTLEPGTAGTYWYHPHPHGRSAHQVAMGLFGALIVRAPDDPLPEGFAEKLLILWDNRLRPDGSVDFAEAGTRQARLDEENGREGDVLFVNGQVMPAIPIRAGQVQRWRVVNASAARVYRLALPGHALLHVGSDGGLFERPVEVPGLVLANSERAELLVRGTGAPGREDELRSLPYDRYLPATRPEGWDRPRTLATVRYADGPPAEPVAVPGTLRPVPVLDAAEAGTTRVFRLSRNRINGRRMEMGRVDQEAELAATEVWEIRNLVGMDHPFHLHGFRFQVLERNGRPEPFRKWEDTVNVPRFGSVRLIVRLDDHPGLWMFHCHILTHEDNGMMGVLEVR